MIEPQEQARILGARLRERRQTLAVSQGELAELAGVSVGFVGQLERGKPSVRLERLMAVANALGLEVHLS